MGIKNSESGRGIFRFFCFRVLEITLINLLERFVFETECVFHTFDFMGTVELKLSLHQLIDGVSDNSVLEAVYTLLSKATANQEEDWYNLLSEEEKASIERGLDDLKHDRVISHDAAMKRISEKISRFKND